MKTGKIISRRRLLTSAPAAAAAMAPAAATALGSLPTSAAGLSDPIFAALKRERETNAAFEAQSEIDDEKVRAALASRPDVPMWKIEREIHANGKFPAFDAWVEAQEAMLQTQATTVSGLLAFINYLTWQEETDEDILPEGWALVALGTIAASIRTMLKNGVIHSRGLGELLGEG